MDIEQIPTASNIFGAYRNGRFSYENYGTSAVNPYLSSDAVNAGAHVHIWQEGFDDAQNGRLFKYTLRNRQKTKTGTCSIPLETVKAFHNGWDARPSEQDAVNYLKERGIYAVLGRATQFRFIDVVAWGCIPIEVKSCQEKDGIFHFRIASRHHKGGVQGKTIMVICNYCDGHKEFYFLPANLPQFYKPDGTLKKAAEWNSRRETRGSGMRDPLTNSIMRQYKDAYGVIEDARQEAIESMKRGDFPY